MDKDGGEPAQGLRVEASRGDGSSGQAKEGAGSGSRGGLAHLADLQGEEQQLDQPDIVPGQVVSETAQGHVFHDQLYRLLA